MRARRSFLSMPADRPRFHEKAEGIAADEVMFDLEDSIAPSNKIAARELMTQSLRRLPLSGKTVAVRVNAIATQWFEADAHAALACDRVDALVIPKVASADDARRLETLLGRLNRRIGLELQIESAQGLEQVGAIASASELVEVLHVGPFDLAASLGVPSSGTQIPEELYVHALIRVLVAARAAGLQVVDGPFTDIRDRQGLERSTRRAARLGYDGKWAIHPDQVAAINEIFTPAAAEVERARTILKAYEDALAAGRGAVALDGEMLDEAIRRWAENTLARSRTDV